MPFRNVAVGVWSYDTHTNTNIPWATRIPLLTAAVARLAQYRDQQAGAAAVGADQKQKLLWNNATGRFSMIFVAPEYMFMGQCAAGLSQHSDDRFLDQNAQEQILTALTGISEQYGIQLVFVPGSTAFKKPFLKQNDCADEIAARYAKLERRIDWGAQQIQGMYHKHGYALSMADARNQPLSGELGGPGGAAARTTNDKLNMLRKGANNRFADTYIGQNKMYMFHRGRVIGTYRKKCDFHEVLPGYAQRTIFIPGDKPGRATVAGVPLGLEICLDHGAGVLTSTPTRIAGALPSVHVLVSASVNIDPTNVVVRDNGYVLHASSSANVTGAWRVTPTGVQDALTTGVGVGNGWLGLGVMELDIP